MTKNIKNIENYKVLFDDYKDEREIRFYSFNQVSFAKDKSHYPDVIFRTSDDISPINPIDEKVMSLTGVTEINSEYLEFNKNPKIVEGNFFYFIYNFDNYYHFVYDTLPYLISFFELKKRIKNLKILINYPNKETKVFYKFFWEFLEILGITKNDLQIVSEYEVYQKVFVSSSYTHGVNSELPPNKRIYRFFKKITSRVCNERDTNTPKKIYISRRTWIHNDFSNIGTNYTLRRRMSNEDQLVDFLKSQGFSEIFTEKLSTTEKIKLFCNVESVIGSIGGGLCNVVFSPPETKLLCIVSPGFLKINNRFKFCLESVNCNYFFDTFHTSTNFYKENMRIQNIKNGIVGEISEVKKDTIVVRFLEEKVSGWNQSSSFLYSEMPIQDVKILDEGLNSEFTTNIGNLESHMKNLFYS